MTLFNSYVGIDYSGAATSSTRLATLQVYVSKPGQLPTQVHAGSWQSSKVVNWTRIELAEWLSNYLSVNPGSIVGIDHAFSFPVNYFMRNELSDWNEFLADFIQHWPCHEPGHTVQQFRIKSKRNGDSTELRITDRWTSSAKSVFQFDVQGSVAKSSHAGIPFIHRLKNDQPDIHAWPFDGWNVPTDVSVVAETYPSLFRRRYDRETRTIDQQDAYSISRWLNEMDSIGQLRRFFDPPLSDQQRTIANNEGWILGVV